MCIWPSLSRISTVLQYFMLCKLYFIFLFTNTCRVYFIQLLWENMEWQNKNFLVLFSNTRSLKNLRFYRMVKCTQVFKYFHHCVLCNFYKMYCFIIKRIDFKNRKMIRVLFIFYNYYLLTLYTYMLKYLLFLITVINRIYLLNTLEYVYHPKFDHFSQTSLTYIYTRTHTRVISHTIKKQK